MVEDLEPEPKTMEVWTNAHSEDQDRRSIAKAMVAGARGRCLECGAKTLFSSYLKVRDRCSACGEAFYHHRADDAPPYFTIFGVGHIVLPSLVTVELAYAPPMWLHLLIWLPLTVALSLALLPRIKGAIVGLQWAHRMHGFGAEEENRAHD